MQPHFQGGGAQNKLADRINSASQAVLTGKGDIRNALLSKEINVPSNPTFQQLSDAISNVQTKEYILVFSDDTPGDYDVTGITGYNELIEMENCKIYSFTTPATLNYTISKLGFNDIIGQISLTSAEPKKILNIQFKNNRQYKLLSNYQTEVYPVTQRISTIPCYMTVFYNISKSDKLRKAMVVSSGRSGSIRPNYNILNYDTFTFTAITYNSSVNYDFALTGWIDEKENKFYSLWNKKKKDASATNFFRDIIDLTTGTVTTETFLYADIIPDHPTMVLEFGGAIVNRETGLSFCSGDFYDPSVSIHQTKITAIIDFKTGLCRKYEQQAATDDGKRRFCPLTLIQGNFAGICYNNKAYFYRNDWYYKFLTFSAYDFDTMVQTTLSDIYLSQFVVSPGGVNFIWKNKYYSKVDFNAYRPGYSDYRVTSPFVNDQGGWVNQMVMMNDIGKENYDVNLLTTTRINDSWAGSLFDYLDLGDGYLTFICPLTQRDYGNSLGYDLSLNTFKVPKWRFESYLF